MAILTDDVLNQVKEVFKKLDQGVELLLVDEGGESEMDTLLQEIASTHEQVSYRRVGLSDVPEAKLREELLPAVLMKGPSGISRARFLGAPAGYEFGVLIQDMVDLSRGEIMLSPGTKSYLDGLQDEVHLQVFSTPT